MRKGINISHVNIENMGGRDQSQVKIKFKKFKKIKSVPKDVPNSHNNDRVEERREVMYWHRGAYIIYYRDITCHSYTA